jgi:hypothetical protein
MDDNRDRRFACNPDVVWKDVGGEMVLIHLETNQIYELSRTGARFWALLDEGKSLGEAEAVLMEEFSVDEDTVRVETDALVEELLLRELVEEQ